MNCATRLGPNSLALTFVALTTFTAGSVVAVEVPSPANLKLVGGYRFPSFYGKAKPTAAFTSGALAVHTAEDGNFTAWTTVNNVLEATTSGPMGDAATPIGQWPLLDEGAMFTKQDLYGDRGGGRYNGPNGLLFDPDGQRLWVTQTSGYNTTADPKQWLAAIDYPAKTVNPVAPNLAGVPMQFYGGGLTVIPQTFADAHLGGRRLGFAAGGYRSGQGASQGPTFAATELTPTNTPTVQQVMHFATTAEVGSDREGAKSRVERTFPEYSSGNISWSQQPDDADGDGIADVGYWASSEIKGGGAWVDLPNFQGLLYMVVQPTGPQDYAFQSEVFTTKANKANNLYVYSPDDLAKAADGEVEPWDLRGKFYRWDQTTNGGLPYRARGLSFDPTTGYLWVLYVEAWGTEGPERQPIIAAYEFVSDISLVQPGDFNEDGFVDLRDFSVWRSLRGTQLSRIEYRREDGKVVEYEVPTYDTDLNNDGVVNSADRDFWSGAIPADANEDGVIDVKDYSIWRSALQPAKALTQQAPEPGSMSSFAVLLLVCSCFWGVR